MAKATSNKVGITARKLCRKYGVASSFVTKVLKEGVKCYKGQKGPKSSPELVSRLKKCCRTMVRNHCKPSSQTELVLRKDIPQNVPQLARLKICGLHLRRPCTVVVGRPKTRRSWREERESVRELDWDVVRTMMAKVKTRLRNAVHKFPLSLLNHGRTQDSRRVGSFCFQADQNGLGGSPSSCWGGGGPGDMLPRENFGKMESSPAILCILAVKTEVIVAWSAHKKYTEIKKKIKNFVRLRGPCGHAGGFFQPPEPPWVRAWKFHLNTPGAI